MPLDHYVSQVHLRNFYSPATNKLFAVSKKSLAKFPCSSKDVCRIQDGSTNSYLLHDRGIEDFLKEIEPRYNSAVDALRRGEPSSDTILAIAGFAAYVVSCSPTAMRVHSDFLRHTVVASAKVLETQGKVPPPPEILGASTMAELLDTGKVKVTVDDKYPQAIGISNVLGTTSMFGNAAWDIIINAYAVDNPFFTSDYPAPLANSADPRVMSRIIPLAPDIAVRITADLSRDRKPDLSFPRMRFRSERPRSGDIREINRLIVQSAEELVFFRDDLYWIPEFVARNRDFRVEPITETIPAGSGYLTIATQRIKPRRDA
jgi:hypothetical protein